MHQKTFTQNLLDPQRLSQAVEEMNLSSLTRLSQCHSKRVVLADPSQSPAADGLVTDRAGLGLVIFHADCQAASFFDPKGVLALVHAGWRGLVQNIYAETVGFMDKHFGCKAKDLEVKIAPCLGVAEFRNFEREFPLSFHKHQVRPYYFDLKAIAKEQLEELGMEKIEIDPRCTLENELFHSYRRDKTAMRNGTIARL